MDPQRIQSINHEPNYYRTSVSISGYLSSHVAAEIIIHQYQPPSEDPNKIAHTHWL